MQFEFNRQSSLWVVVTLLVFSVSTAAQNSAAAATPIAGNRPVQLITNARVSGLSHIKPSVSAKNAAVNSRPAPHGSEFGMGRTVMRFPHWSHKRTLVRKLLPPPPPGPYNSFAYNINPLVDADIQYIKPAPVPAIEASSATRFSPNTPWPGDKGSVNRWRPDDGYHFVAPGFMPPMPVPMPIESFNYPQPVYLPPARPVMPVMNNGIRPPRQLHYNAPGLIPNHRGRRPVISHNTPPRHTLSSGRRYFEPRYRVHSELRQRNNQAGWIPNGNGF